EDRGVDPRDEDRKVELRWRPGDAVDDADEEVRREERAEEHDLRRDEEEHAEDRCIDARALMGKRRPVMLRCGVRRHQLDAPAVARSATTCSTGTFVSARRRSI